MFTVRLKGSGSVSARVWSLPVNDSISKGASIGVPPVFMLGQIPIFGATLMGDTTLGNEGKLTLGFLNLLDLCAVAGVCEDWKAKAMPLLDTAKKAMMT